MGIDGPVLLLLSILFIFIVPFFLFRWIFAINKFLAYQKAQTALLIEIAKKQEIDNNRLGEIIGELHNS